MDNLYNIMNVLRKKTYFSQSDWEKNEDLYSELKSPVGAENIVGTSGFFTTLALLAFNNIEGRA